VGGLLLRLSKVHILPLTCMRALAKGGAVTTAVELHLR